MTLTVVFALAAAFSNAVNLMTQQEKVVDVVGLCHNPPERAVVLCVDEKSQIRAYPGDDPGVCDGGQEPDMTGSGSLTDGISGVSPQRSQRPRTDAHGRSACPCPGGVSAYGARHASWPGRRCFCNGSVRNRLTCKDVSADFPNPG